MALQLLLAAPKQQAAVSQPSQHVVGGKLVLALAAGTEPDNGISETAENNEPNDCAPVLGDVGHGLIGNEIIIGDMKDRTDQCQCDRRCETEMPGGQRHERHIQNIER